MNLERYQNKFNDYIYSFIENIFFKYGLTSLKNLSNINISMVSILSSLFKKNMGFINFFIISFFHFSYEAW